MTRISYRVQTGTGVRHSGVITDAKNYRVGLFHRNGNINKAMLRRISKDCGARVTIGSFLHFKMTTGVFSDADVSA